MAALLVSVRHCLRVDGPSAPALAPLHRIDSVASRSGHQPDGELLLRGCDACDDARGAGHPPDAALTPRERSLVTITNLVALYRHNKLGFHIRKGLENGLTQDEIIAVITHSAFLFRLADRDDGDRHRARGVQAEIRPARGDSVSVSPCRSDINQWHPGYRPTSVMFCTRPSATPICTHCRVCALNQ